MTVESWMTTNSQLLAALRNQSVSNNLIRSFVVIIVALGISSVLVVSVVQKQKEIGILRAMGTSSNRIMGVFLLQGALVGFVGALSGVDFMLGHACHMARRLDCMPEEMTHLHAYMKRLEARPAFAKGIMT